MTYLDPPTEPDYVSMEAGDEAVEKIARAFHDEYEAWAQASGWETQEATRTSFDDLPPANRQAMLLTVRSLLERGVVRASHPTPDGEERDWIPCGGTGLKTWAATGNTVPTFLCPGCPDCTPDGPASPVDCAYCNGQGWVEGVGDHCDQDGEYIGSETVQEECPACNGTGKESAPPASPVLGDEERERLSSLASWLHHNGRVNVAEETLSLLRKLASQEEGRN